MHHMEKATVRDLRYRFPRVEALLQEGEEIRITKHKRVIARLVPERPSSVPRLPAFATRLAKIYGRKKLAASGAVLIRAERDERN
jgi:antitoxin (DNA-binding transcriptional repressor) of toxin-antitoxin stability system